MAAITLKLLTNGPHVINDLGITIEGIIGDTYNLVGERAEDVSRSTDLQSAVDSGAFVALDPRDATGLTQLTAANTKIALTNHNQIHWGIVGGRFASLDDPTSALTEGSVVTIGANGAAAIATPLATLLTATPNTESVHNIVGDMFTGESDITYDNTTGTFDLEDNFLRNTGDVLDSGTLSVTSGATINIESGGELTIQDDPVNPTDAANKRYVDALANGMDHKASVQVATDSDLGVTFTDNGGVGDTLRFASAGTTSIDGVTVANGNRVLVKNQTDATQNGIYVVSSASSGGITTLTRAEDQDGSSSNEVSAGNTTFVEQGTINGSTGWVVTGDGELTVNTDDIIWTQNSGMGTYLAGEGIFLNGNEFALVTSNISVATGSVETTDELIIGDASDSLNTAKTTIGDVLSDLNIINGIDTNGFAVRTADDTYESRSFEVEPAGPKGGLVISNADGLSDNPTFGLDIQNTATRDAVTATDLVMVYDASSDENRTYSIADIAGVAVADTFKTWTAAGNTTGDSNIIAVGGDDEATITGGAGVTLDFNNGTQNVTFAITGAGITSATTADNTDEIVLYDPTTGVPKKLTISDFVDDLDLTTILAESTVAGQEGIVIDLTDPQLPVVGLDIDGLADAADDLSATDELVMFDGTNNVSVSGQQIADGVADILDLPVLVSSTINGQPVITVADATRSNKQLSLDSNTFMYSENSLSNNDWIEIAGAGDADSGYVMPLDGTIIMASAHCENADNATTIKIYQNASTTSVADAGSFTASPNAQFVNTTLDVDFAQGDRIRLRNVGGSIQDTVVNIFIKWRS